MALRALKNVQDSYTSECNDCKTSDNATRDYSGIARTAATRGLIFLV
jgi:hypothetical protein